MFVTASHLHSSITFAGKATSLIVECSPKRGCNWTDTSKWKWLVTNTLKYNIAVLVALVKCVTMMNTRAYNITVLITAIKCIIMMNTQAYNTTVLITAVKCNKGNTLVYCINYSNKMYYCNNTQASNTIVLITPINV